MAAGVTILTPLVGGVNGFTTAIFYGGPALAVWGWFAVSAFTFFEVLGMCEIASAYPTAGGMYHWTYLLTESAWMAWTFGWMEFLGQLASVSGVAVIFSNFVQAVVVQSTATIVTTSDVASSEVGGHLQTDPLTANGTLVGVSKTQASIFGIYCGVLIVSGILK